MASNFNVVLNKNSFEYNLQVAKERSSSQKKKGVSEAFYTSVYLRTVVAHLKDIISKNPNLTTNEINTILFKEIDDYSKTVFENAYVFGQYLDYLCCQYLALHPDKYKEISKQLLESKENFEDKTFNDCSNFDDYLLLYTYKKKKELFEDIFEGFEASIPPTPDNYKKFDELLKQNISLVSKSYFDNYFSLPEVAAVFNSNDSFAKKKSTIKNYALGYKIPKDRKNFELYANIFLQGSFPYIASEQEYTTSEIRKDLARATSRTVEQLDNLGHLDNYMTDFVFEMSRMEYPELARVICDNGFPTQDYIDSVVSISKDLSTLEKSKDSLPESEKEQVSTKIRYLKKSLAKKKNEVRPYLNKSKLKASLNENYLYSTKSLSIESLLALNSFWANRYIKELDLYSQTMFATHKFDLVDKVKNNESVFISLDDLDKMLIQMDTFYNSANTFLQHMQDISDSDTSQDEKEYEEGDVEEKIIRFSYEPFINKISNNFGKKYSEYFSYELPNQTHNLEDDANWYIRLYNPVFSSYLMKNEMLNVLLLSIDNSNSENFPNAGIILEDHSCNSTESPDGTSATIPYFPVIGIDAGLSFPVRIHVDKPVLIDFLKSFNGDALLPIYEGASDFHHPYKSNSPLAAALIMPPTDKIKNTFKSGIKKNEFAEKNSPDYHPNARFVSHLAFISSKKAPKHLQVPIESKGKNSKTGFRRRYIDLETNIIYEKVNDKFYPISPKKVQIKRRR